MTKPDPAPDNLKLAVSVIILTVLALYFIYLAALGDVPKQLYDAARLDGAGRWRQFVHVTLPMLSWQRAADSTAPGRVARRACRSGRPVRTMRQTFAPIAVCAAVTACSSPGPRGAGQSPGP